MNNLPPVRLSKLMSERGICSRREADEWIRRGWVFVNKEKIATLGTKVDPNVKIDLNSNAWISLRNKVSIILNKPIGYLSSPSDDGYRLAKELISRQNQDLYSRQQQKFSIQHLQGLSSAGRLDIDSKGLLLFTQNGVLAKKIIGENSSIEKEYLVRVRGFISPHKIKQLSFGLQLDDKPLKMAQIKELEPGLLQFILREGKKRQIRRMCQIVDLEVVFLKRVRIGKIVLGNLKEGKWRYLLPHEEP